MKWNSFNFLCQHMLVHYSGRRESYSTPNALTHIDHTVWHCTEHSLGVISVIDNTSKPNMPAVSYTHSLTIHLYTVSWCIRISYGPKYNYICNMESTIPNQTRQTVYEFDANKFYYLNWSVTVTRLPPDSCLKKKNYHLIVITFGICWTVHLIGSMHFTWYTMHAT